MLSELLDSAVTPKQLEELERLVAEQEARANPFVVKTLAEVAAFFGYSIQTVKQWRLETPPAPGREGAWPLDEICRWRLAKSETSDIHAAKKQAELDLQRLQIEAKRLEVAEQQGRLMDRTDVERFLSESIIETREAVLAIPDAVAVSMPPEQREFVRSEVDRIIREALGGYAARLESDFRAALASADAMAESPVDSIECTDAAGDGDGRIAVQSRGVSSS